MHVKMFVQDHHTLRFELLTSDNESHVMKNMLLLSHACPAHQRRRVNAVHLCVKSAVN